MKDLQTLTLEELKALHEKVNSFGWDEEILGKEPKYLSKKKTNREKYFVLMAIETLIKSKRAEKCDNCISQIQ